jgi:HSP20 family protein
MSEEMERVLSGLPTAQPDGGAAFWVPAIEVTENNGACVIRAELPGLKTEDVKVEVADGVLTLEGERKVEHEAEHGGVYRTERMYGRFYRRIPLPDGAKVDRAQAKFDNGVLEISVPVAHDNRRQIPVRTTADNGAVKQQA